jgi:uncharacterized protein YecT (DUF1311 family)
MISTKSWAAAVSLALIIPGTASWAQAGTQPTYSATYQECMKHTRDVDYETRQCQGAELTRMDHDLNAVYRDLTAALDKDEPARKPLLVTSERAWLAYRNAQCEFRAPLKTAGTLDWVVHYNCQLKITDERIKDLKDELDLSSFVSGKK